MSTFYDQRGNFYYSSKDPSRHFTSAADADRFEHTSLATNPDGTQSHVYVDPVTGRQQPVTSPTTGQDTYPTMGGGALPPSLTNLQGYVTRPPTSGAGGPTSDPNLDRAREEAQRQQEQQRQDQLRNEEYARQQQLLQSQHDQAVRDANNARSAAEAEAARQRQADAARQLAALQATAAENERQRQAAAASQATDLSGRLSLQKSQAQLDAEAEARRQAASQAAQDKLFARLPGLFGFLTGSSGAPGTAAADGSAASAVDVAGTGAQGAPGSPDPAQSARDLAFARAKDKIGALARSSLMSLRSAASERGANVAGGSNPSLARAEGSLMNNAQAPLADLVTSQAEGEANRANSLADQRRKDAITMRGQNLALAPSLLSLMKAGSAGIY